MISTVFLAKNLKLELVGILGYVRSTNSTLVMLGGLGMALTATRYLAVLSSKVSCRAEEKTEIIALTLITGLVSSLFVFILASLFLEELLVYSEISLEFFNIIQFALCGIVVIGVDGVLSGIIKGLDDFKAEGIMLAFANLISFCVIILGLYFESLYLIVAGFLTSYLFHAMFSLFYLAKRGLLDFNISSQAFLGYFGDAFVKFSLPSFFGSLVVFPAFYLSNIWLSKSTGLADLAVFDVINQWRLILLFIPSVLSQVFFTAYSKNSSNQNEFKHTFRVSVWLNSLITVILLGFVLMFSEQILLAYGEEFVRGRQSLVLISVSSALIVINNLFGNVLLSRNLVWLGLSVNILWAVVFLVWLNWELFVLGSGILGLARAYLVSYSALMLINLSVIRSKRLLV